MNYQERVHLAHRLRAAGFGYYAFVSYPHTDRAMKAFAVKFHREFQDMVRQNLPTLSADPEADRVFFDRHDIPPGVTWQPTLSRALCRSVTMIALCVPMYANSPWCGREWQGMVDLGAMRLPQGVNPIFVVRLGELDLPEIINRIQQFSFQNRALRSLHRSRDFDGCLQAAFHHVCRVTEAWTGQSIDCDNYRPPERSPFEPTPPPPPPNRSSGL